MEEDTMVAPEIVKKLPETVHTRPGETIKLEVKAVGKPKPTPKWCIANEEIIPSENYYIENYPDGRSVLIISNAQPEIVNSISFAAVSPLGIAKTVTELRVEGIRSFDMDFIENTLMKKKIGYRNNDLSLRFRKNKESLSFPGFMPFPNFPIPLYFLCSL